jgi:hypothetical protein
MRLVAARDGDEVGRHAARDGDAGQGQTHDILVEGSREGIGDTQMVDEADVVTSTSGSARNQRGEEPCSTVSAGTVIHGLPARAQRVAALNAPVKSSPSLVRARPPAERTRGGPGPSCRPRTGCNM